MCYDVYYRLVKFQLKIPHMHEEIKRTNCIRTKGHSLRCKINQTIVYGVIQTFAIVRKSNLRLFPFKFKPHAGKCRHNDA